MKISSNVITCKSDPMYYTLEESGKKRNTVRSISGIISDGYTCWDISKCTKITIVNTEDCNSFTRELSDITVYQALDIVIFSW